MRFLSHLVGPFRLFLLGVLAGQRRRFPEVLVLQTESKSNYAAVVNFILADISNRFIEIMYMRLEQCRAGIWQNSIWPNSVPVLL